jgi:hydroxymethylbilane synthase
MLPIAVRPNGRRAVIVGGGNVALRKAETLAAAGFSLVAVAPALDDALRATVAAGGGLAIERAYTAGDLDGAFLAIAATNDDAVNALVVDDARRAGILVCDASSPERGDFTMPAVVRSGDLTFSVDTAGGAPAFSKRVAREIAAAFGPEYAGASKTLARMRTYVKTILPAGERANVLRALAELPVEALSAMNPIQADDAVEATIEKLRETLDARQTSAVVAATRGSALAMTQTRAVAAKLAERGTATTILEVKTTGDRITDRPIAELGNVNVFVTELETALRDERADYAVHSCKDLPSELAADMQIAAFSAREDARDAYCSERFPTFESLPEGARVGTSSPRRERQLAALRPDLRYEPIRGNVDTRLRKLRDGEFDAIVLAMAGLNRLRVRATHTVAFPADVLVPAVGQGALAIEVRAGDDTLGAILRDAVNDAASELCVRCERAALRELRMGCNAPVGIHATLDGDVLAAVGAYALASGIERVGRKRFVTSAADAEALGAELGRALAEIVAPMTGTTVVLPRTQERASRIAAALRARGADVIELRAGDPGPQRPPDILIFPSSGSVAAAGAYLAGLRRTEGKPLVLAMGPESSEAARAAGFPPDAVAPEASIDSLVRLASAKEQPIRP